MFNASAKKRQRVGSSGRLSSYADNAETKPEDSSISPAPVLRRLAASIIPGGFNDPATADVVLRLQLEGSPESSAVDGFPEPDLPSAPSLELHLNSSPLGRSGYFAARLSDRWLRPDPSSPAVSSGLTRLTLKIPNHCYSRRPFDAHVTVLKLLYTLDFTGSIISVTDALELLPVALELLFDDCIRACVRFLEAVPWTDEEEEGVLGLIPFLREEESRDLLARVFPSAAPMDGDGKTLSEEMLHALILKAIHSNPRLAAVKAFVAKLLRDYPSRDSVQNVLDRAFLESLGTVKELLGEYASPDFRVAGDNDETEAIHRLKLHAAMVNARNLFWLVERMLELRIADTAAREWSQQPALTADLQKTFREDGWRNIAPGLPSLVLRCTYGLANAIAAGSILAPRQVRVEFVRQWLPVLNVCREKTFPISGQKMIFQDMEETFLQIISTLPLRDAHDLLQQCLCFSARDFGGCPHLVLAFNTWFRRANMHPDSTR